MTLDDLRRLNAYNRWANHRLLDVAGTLDPEHLTQPLGGSFGSLMATLRHVLGAEWTWLERFHGRSPRAFEAESTLGTLAAVRARWSSLDSEYAAFLDGLGEADVIREVAYRSFKGDAFRHPLGVLLQHVFNHSTHHRGQVSARSPSRPTSCCTCGNSPSGPRRDVSAGDALDPTPPPPAAAGRRRAGNLRALRVGSAGHALSRMAVPPDDRRHADLPGIQ